MTVMSSSQTAASSWSNPAAGRWPAVSFGASAASRASRARRVSRVRRVRRARRAALKVAPVAVLRAVLRVVLLGVLLGALSCAAPSPKLKPSPPESPVVETLDLGIANAFIVMGQRPILVDTGADSTRDKLVQALRARGVEPSSLALVILTHGHADHAGGAAMLQRDYGVPVLAGMADEAMLMAGKNSPLKPLSVMARLIKPFVDDPFEPISPAFLIDSPFDLSSLGVRGQVLPMPGHTPGSLIVRLEDGRTLVGDALGGGAMGGALWPSSPKTHYFHDHADEAHRQIATWLDGATTIYVGHGGPLSAQDVRRWHADP